MTPLIEHIDLEETHISWHLLEENTSIRPSFVPQLSETLSIRSLALSETSRPRRRASLDVLPGHLRSADVLGAPRLCASSRSTERPPAWAGAPGPAPHRWDHERVAGGDRGGSTRVSVAGRSDAPERFPALLASTQNLNDLYLGPPTTQHLWPFPIKTGVTYPVFQNPVAPSVHCHRWADRYVRMLAIRIGCFRWCREHWPSPEPDSTRLYHFYQCTQASCVGWS